MGSQRDCKWILACPDFALRGSTARTTPGSGRLYVQVARRGRRYPCSGCGRQTNRRAVDEGAHLGRSAVGGASRDTHLSAAPRHLSPLRDSDRADRVVRGRQGAGNAPIAAADWRRLSVDADTSHAAAGTRYLEGLLFGLTPLDPSTFEYVAAAFALIALLASYVPARRTTRVDRLLGLRCEWRQ